MEFRSRQATEPESALPGYLDDARRLFADAVAGTGAGSRTRTQPPRDPPLTADFEHLRWFWLPREIASELEGCEVSAGAGI